MLTIVMEYLGNNGYFILPFCYSLLNALRMYEQYPLPLCIIRNFFDFVVCL